MIFFIKVLESKQTVQTYEHATQIILTCQYETGFNWNLDRNP